LMIIGAQLGHHFPSNNTHPVHEQQYAPHLIQLATIIVFN